MDTDRKKAEERDPTVKTVHDQQHTGNHGDDSRPRGADRFGGTRAGAENVEPAGKKKER